MVAWQYKRKDMLEWYKKFCYGLFYLFRDKIKSDVPYYATFMFTLFLFVSFIFGCESLIYILLKKGYQLNKFLVYGSVIIFAIPNYLIVFKNKDDFEKADKKLSYLTVTIISIFILVASLILVLLGGVRNKNSSSKPSAQTINLSVKPGSS